METKRRYEHPTPAAGATPAAVSPERALRVFTQPERNPGIPLDLDLVRALRINRSAVERRAATIPTRRTVKKEWQAAWLLRAITCIDLTTLQGDDTPTNVLRLCAKAKSPVRPDLLAALGATDIGITVGAVCVYHAFVPLAVEALQGSAIPVAAVSTGFPAGLNPLPQRIEEIQASVAAGAQEIDVVITRAHALAGAWEALYDEVRAFREACGEARRDGGDRDPRACQRLDRERDEGVIYAHGADPDAELGRAQGVEQVAADRVLRLGAQPEHVGRRVVALECGQVHAGDRAQQPGGLPFLLDGAAGRDGSRPALDSAAVDPQGAHQVQVERGAGIPLGGGEDPQRPFGRDHRRAMSDLGVHPHPIYEVRMQALFAAGRSAASLGPGHGAAARPGRRLRTAGTSDEPVAPSDHCTILPLQFP